MTINIEPAKGGKLSLLCDGEYVLTVDPDTWYSLDYTNGCEIDDEEFEKLRFLIQSRKAYAQALRFLTLRAHSAKELFTKLSKKHTPECCEYAVEKCRELGFIDDDDFALRYAQELYERKNYGPSRIRTELFAKGIDRETADNALSQIDFDCNDAIINIIEKKYSSCLGDEKGMKRMIAGLMRAGYSYGDIRAALRDYDIPEES